MCSEGARRPALLFVPLAMNQTRFYAALARAMATRGHPTAHLAYHQGSVGWLERRGETAFDAFAEAARAGEADPAAFGVEDEDGLLLHERVFFARRDRERIRREFRRYLAGATGVLERFAPPGKPVVVVQELGGFASVLAVLYAARARGAACLFIEPSFFRGRVFFTADSLAAPSVAEPGPIAVSPEVQAYLDATRATQAINIPAKDRHHFRSADAKLRDPHNMRRLVEKLWDKHVLGRREVFDRVGLHVARHVGMAARSRRLRTLYRPLPEGAPFVYYPLHVPTDVALTIRSPACLDQYALIERLLTLVPPGTAVAVKEHPALVGAVSYDRLRALAARHPHFAVLDPRLNNYAVMRAAAAIVTVNSKSGAEALLLGRRVIVLGDAFYRPSASVAALPDPTDDAALAAALAAAVRGQMPAPDPDRVACYFQAVWDRSRPGELYDLDPANVDRFARSLAAEAAARAA